MYNTGRHLLLYITCSELLRVAVTPLSTHLRSQQIKVCSRTNLVWWKPSAVSYLPYKRRLRAAKSWHFHWNRQQKLLLYEVFSWFREGEKHHSPIFFFNIKHTSKPWSYAENLPLLSLASTFIVQLVLNMTLFQTLVEEGFDFVSNLIIWRPVLDSSAGGIFANRGKSISP